MESINETLKKISKAMATPTYIAGPILVRENLSGIITNLTLKQTPIRDRLARKPGAGLAASWNVMTAIVAGNSPFAEGTTPTENDQSYARRSAIYKELGKTKSVTDKMIAAGKTFFDAEAEQTEVGLREVIQDEEQLIITGNASTNPLAFDGLKTLITTNVQDDDNSALGFRTDILDEAVETLTEDFNVIPTAIYCSFAMKRAINQSLANDVRVNLDQTNQVATGIEVGFYQSTVGKLPIVPTFAIANDTTTYPGNKVSDIYLVTEKAGGQDVLYMEDLYPLGKSMLDRTGAAIKFMITECTVLVNRAEEFHVRITNVRVK
jgi:hypothetical protein